MTGQHKSTAQYIDAAAAFGVSVVVNKDGGTRLPALKVPERLIDGIAKIGEISQEGFDQLLEALKRAPACKDSRELLAWIGNETPALSENERNGLLNSVIPMLRVQRNADVSVSAFARDVWHSIADSSPSRAKTLDETLFQTRTAQLIGESALDLASSRIDDAKREVERNFCKVKIMTDLRPAFRKDPIETPSEIAVIHHFQIGYHNGMGKHKEFYISLDQGDLESLKKAIAEADNKVETLRRVFAQTGVSIHT